VSARDPGADRVRAIFIGSGGFGIGSLRRLSEHPLVKLVAVVTAPPRPTGRRQALTATPVETAARELGLAAVLSPPRLRDPDAVAEILALDPALVVLADYGRLVPPPLLAVPHGALNLHPSLLPRHRGATPIPAAILAGDSESGVTLFLMDAGLDTGPILAAERVALQAGVTAPELEARLASLAPDVLERTLRPWLRGDLTPMPQPRYGATLTRTLRREDGRLDPSRPAAELERAVRAYRPWPGTFLDLPIGRLGVVEADVAASQDGDAPGTLVPDDNGLALATADGRLRLVRVQPAGGREMSGAAFRRGRPGSVDLASTR
jgi:methionyl-tRNA formyltransferase